MRVHHLIERQLLIDLLDAIAGTAINLNLDQLQLVLQEPL